MSITVVNQAGAKQTASLSVPKATELKPSTLAVVARVQLANQKRQRGKTKTRGEVAGGGAKPWRQKGTGRARAGSNRSPIWVGGGITFGPSGAPRARKHVPAKVRKAALFNTLNTHAAADGLTVVQGALKFETTKAAAGFFGKVAAGRTLFVVVPGELDAVRGAANLRDVELVSTADCSVADLIGAHRVVASAAAFDVWTKGTAPAPKAPAKTTPKSPAKTPTKEVAKPAATTPAKTAPKAPAKVAAKKPGTTKKETK